MITISDVLRLFATPLGVHIQKLLLGIVLLIIAVLIAKLVQSVCCYIFNLVKIDALSGTIGLKGLLKKTGINNSFTSLLGDMIFWLVVLASGIAIIYALNYITALKILRVILNYLSGNVINALFVLILTVVLGSLLSGVILFLGGLIFLPGYRLIAKLAQYVTVIYGIVMGLDMLGISAQVIARPDIILGFFALAGAIAFGLGCKDLAASWLANFIRDTRE
ncbi:MAG: hypothetical protein NTZ10_03365 [Candidatus Saganbacteria bacterium]|nr:hypothetical protein [Candidatus Saganbacteria bacterium]